MHTALVPGWQTLLKPAAPLIDVLSVLATPPPRLSAPLGHVGWARQSVPLTVYGIQLALNLLWTPLFFKMHWLGLASVEILGREVEGNGLVSM